VTADVVNQVFQKPGGANCFINIGAPVSEKVEPSSSSNSNDSSNGDPDFSNNNRDSSKAE
jgi:hypothetical protein